MLSDPGMNGPSGLFLSPDQPDCTQPGGGPTYLQAQVKCQAVLTSAGLEVRKYGPSTALIELKRKGNSWIPVLPLWDLR